MQSHPGLGSVDPGAGVKGTAGDSALARPVLGREGSPAVAGVPGPSCLSPSETGAQGETRVGRAGNIVGTARKGHFGYRGGCEHYPRPPERRNWAEGAADMFRAQPSIWSRCRINPDWKQGVRFWAVRAPTAGAVDCIVLENFKGRQILLCVTFFSPNGVFSSIAMRATRKLFQRSCVVCTVRVTAPAQRNSSCIFKYQKGQHSRTSPFPQHRLRCWRFPGFPCQPPPIGWSPCSREANLTELLQILLLQALKMSSACTERL